jgi:hypothetical protein
LSRASVELAGDGVEVVGVVAGEVGSFGEVLAEQVSLEPRCRGECGSQKYTCTRWRR